MKIGIIGHGVVGETVDRAFTMQGHTIKWHDKYKDQSAPITELSDSDCIFVCVPTDTVDDLCDVSNVVDTVNKLSAISFTGVIIIKSTVVPGTTQNLISKYPNLRLNFVPEFLHQDNALEDFQHLTKTLIVGSHNNNDFELISKLHSPFSPCAVKIDPTEAELVKYFANNFNSLRIVFANAYYEICELLGVSYDRVLNAAITLPYIQHDSYLKCNQNLRGYTGKCLPKDIKAFGTFAKNLNLPITLFDAVINDNERYNKQ